ncbi:MAG: RloB family protein [Gammaproteobacteria bacterium]|nr:RloB family protein [Gammaproteobacteria bacterium]
MHHYKLNTANVAIDGTCGSSPNSVFKRATEKYISEKSKGDSYDRVYCVFDKDSHETYESTIRSIAKQNEALRKELGLTAKHKIFYASTSVPCFEYWLLLHFQYTTSPYAATATSSIANQVLKDLKKVMSYSKGDKNVFDTLFNQLDFILPGWQSDLLLSRQQNQTL